MSQEQIIQVVRWLCFYGGISNFLAGTILASWLDIPVLRWLFLASPGSRPSGETGPRIWRLVSAVIFLGIWWYLGTPGGHAAAGIYLRMLTNAIRHLTGL